LICQAAAALAEWFGAVWVESTGLAAARARPFVTLPQLHDATWP
jgi:hypothetical protein